MKQHFKLLPAFLSITLALAGCKREKRTFEKEPSSANVVQTVAVTSLHPGGTEKPIAFRNPSEEKSQDISDGKRLFDSYNCSGCHAHGGGDKGPALMDDKWYYGSNSEQIFASIVQGRPKGMPAFAGKIPDDQVWKIVAYVRSLSGLVRKDVAGGRDDHMQSKKPENSIAPREPKNVSSN